MTEIQETAVVLTAKSLQLEGRLGASDGHRGAVVTHPHPQYGGTMDNTVVETMVRAYQSRGWTTLRFNFRGAGNSQGAYDHGQGEQQDVHAAIAHLRQVGVQTIELAGYSFGAWVVALWAQHNAGHGHGLRLVAPPVAFMDYQAIGRTDGLVQVIAGAQDEIAPADRVASQMPVWQPQADLKIIDGADHFFAGHLAELHDALARAIPG